MTQTEIKGRPQKPYANGVTLYRTSGWAGNGFGNQASIQAVYQGRVIGEYESRSHSVSSKLEGHSDVSFSPDYEFYGKGPSRTRVTTKTRYAKWLSACKTWTPKDGS